MKMLPAVIAFIEQRHPKFLSAMKGLSDDEIAALLANLPASYVEFLVLMGVDSNGFSPFGPTQDYHFLTIEKRLNDYKTSGDFYGHIIRSVFYYFGLRNIEARSEIHVHKPDMYQDVLSLLLSMGLMPAMPLLDDVSCLQGGPLIIMLEADDIKGMLTLNFGSRDPKAVKTLRQQLLTNPLIQSK
jgi:hypothetical protein